MYKRLNITLSDDVLARADAFAKRERYSRSALIAAALDAFVSGKAGSAEVARETTAVYAEDAVGLNPAVRPLVPAIVEACRRHGVTYAALVGSSTQPDPAIVPRDLDLLVRFEPRTEGYAHTYFDLKADLGALANRDVDLIEIDAVRNVRLRKEFERTKVVLYETT
jgi:predicted nucleotidyltransferase/predicted transcriptional regulator